MVSHSTFNRHCSYADFQGDLTTGTLSLGSKDKGLAIHGKFEADASLTRNDYYTNGGGMSLHYRPSVALTDLQTTLHLTEHFSDT
jgi:hypothetical protein